MRQPLRKLAASVQLRYTDGTYACHLVGTDFHLEKSSDLIALCVNLGCNLESSQSFDCRRDAAVFLRRHLDLQSIHVLESGMAQILNNIMTDYPAKYWNLELFLERTFSYAVVPQINGSRISLTIPGRVPRPSRRADRSLQTLPY
jgi:hypothetical protein